MKYKILTEFLPGVIVGQECESYFKDGYDLIAITVDKEREMTITESYAKQHPEIFQPIEELKENETEFENMFSNVFGSRIGKCKKCSSFETMSSNFCSNCGRKRKI